MTFEDLFINGHFTVRLPNGDEDDYGTNIPDFYASKVSESPGECVDLNGVECEGVIGTENNHTLVKFNLFEIEYEDGTRFDDVDVVAVCDLDISGDYAVLVVHDVRGM